MVSATEDDDALIAPLVAAVPQMTALARCHISGVDAPAPGCLCKVVEEIVLLGSLRELRVKLQYAAAPPEEPPMGPVFLRRNSSQA